MSELDTLVQNKIKGLITQLFHHDEAVCEDAFASLCLFFSDSDVTFIDSQLRQQGDIRSTYWLLRYLVWIERPIGFEKLFSLIKSADETVSSEARQAVLRISSEPRIDLLVRMLSLSDNETVIFAARHLGRLRAPRTLQPIIDAFDQNDDPEVKTEILTALGKLRDVRALGALERWVSHSEGKVQEEALAAVGLFAKSLRGGFLKRYLRSNNPRIREIAYQTATRFLNDRWEAELAKCLRVEPIEKLKMSFLSAIRRVRTRNLFSVIFAWAAYSPSLKLSMMAKSLIHKARSQTILKWLLALAAKKDRRSQELALQLLSDYKTEAVVFQCYTRQFRTTKSDRTRLIIVEKIGSLSDRRSMEFLLALIENKSPFSLAACQTVVKNLKPNHWKIVERILAFDPDRYQAEIQTLLSFILRMPPNHYLPPDIENKISKLMSATSKYVRYLAVRCFARLEPSKKVLNLTTLADRDPEPLIRLAASKCLLSALNNDPSLLHSLVPSCLENHRLFALAHQLFKQVEHSENSFSEMSLKLVALVLELNEQRPKYFAFRRARALVLLRLQILFRKTFFFKLLQDDELKDEERLVLMHVLNRTDLHNLSGLDPSFMIHQYERASHQTKLEFLAFFQHLAVRPPGIDNLVFKSLAVEENDPVKVKLNQVIHDWLTLSQVPSDAFIT